MIGDVCFEADDPIIWSCDQKLVVCQLDLRTGQFCWTVRGGEEVESNVTGWDTDSLPGSYSRPLATLENRRGKWWGESEDLVALGQDKRKRLVLGP